MKQIRYFSSNRPALSTTFSIFRPSFRSHFQKIAKKLNFKDSLGADSIWLASSNFLPVKKHLWRFLSFTTRSSYSWQMLLRNTDLIASDARYTDAVSREYSLRNKGKSIYEHVGETRSSAFIYSKIKHDVSYDSIPLRLKSISSFSHYTDLLRTP